MQSLSSWSIPNVLKKRAYRQRPEVIPRVAPDGATRKLGAKCRVEKGMIRTELRGQDKKGHRAYCADQQSGSNKITRSVAPAPAGWEELNSLTV